MRNGTSVSTSGLHTAKGPVSRPGWAKGSIAGLVLLLFLVLPATAWADEGPPMLWKGCPSGSGAGQCSNNRGIATDPVNGHVYIASLGNARVNELTPWGGFVKAWGWGVRNGAPELQTCTTATGCQAGIEGSGPGQFDSPQGMAVDSQGDIYVVDKDNHRVQKFDSNGNFLLMWGGGVDQGPNHAGDICTAAFIAEGDTCGAGGPGNAPGQFDTDWPFGSYIAVGPEDEIYVGDVDRIQVFDTQGQFQSEIAVSGSSPLAALAVDPVSGDIYYSRAVPLSTPDTEKFPVTRLDPESGNALGTLATDRPTALAVDPEGSVFVFEFEYRPERGVNPASHPARLVEFDSTGKRIAIFADEVVRDNGFTEFDSSTGIATGSACFSGNTGLYVGNSVEGRSFVIAYGIPDNTDVCPPPPAAPEITAEYARSVDATGAVLGADINPNFWPDTTYRVHYGTVQCIEEGGWEAPCVSEHPNGSPSNLGGGVTDKPVSTPNVFLSGLEPDTAYRYRFEAQSSGGGPTLGTGEEFHTAPLATLDTNCPNQAFRSGASAALPDCRAHELVSPLDKAGGDVQARLNVATFVTRMDQSSLTGDGLTFSAARAFAGALSSPFSSQYLARRDAGSGWQTEALNPPQEGPVFVSLALQIDNPYRAFSPELETGWLQTATEPVIGPGGVPGHPNLYRRENAGGSYGGCTSAPPQLTPESDHGIQPQGFSADHDLGVFRMENKLTDDASSQRKSAFDNRPIYQLYACSFEGPGQGAQLHLVSVLPNGNASTLENTAGGPANESFQFDQGRTATLENAVSTDGSKVFWTASASGDATSPGALYVRLNPTGEPSEPAQCPEEEEPEAGVACTLRISLGPARFWTAAADGSTAIYSVGGSLFEYDLETRKSEPIAGETRGVLGASEDASRVYYFSREVLDTGAAAGELNLYLHEGDTETFIATLDEFDDAFNRDLKLFPGPANPEPVYHNSRISPDGEVVAFMSTSASLAEQVAGYDNTDQISGEPAAEIYRYAIGEGLFCISCNGTGARPIGRDLKNLFLPSASGYYAAARLQPWENSLYAPRALSDDGDRIFFESFGPLVSSDTNGKADVYQWELEGTGDCEESDPAFVEASNGCVDLISSGKSQGDSEFVDASISGEDVFIRTSSSLVGWDPGQIDIYDARVNGGFNAPPGIPAGCEGEACQGPIAPPNDPTPASSTFSGAGNVREAAKAKKKKAKAKKKKATRKRNKGKRRAKGRKAKQRSAAARAKHDRRQGR